MPVGDIGCNKSRVTQQTRLVCPPVPLTQSTKSPKKYIFNNSSEKPQRNYPKIHI